METKEKQIRSIRKAKAIEFLNTFLGKDKEVIADMNEYGIYSYTEVLNALSVAAVKERERIKQK